jgi:hypothetical protein
MPGFEESDNEIRYRLKEPSLFDENSFRSKDIDTGVRLILGHLNGEESMTAQALRFSKDVFKTVEDAKQWKEQHWDKSEQRYNETFAAEPVNGVFTMNHLDGALEYIEAEQNNISEQEKLSSDISLQQPKTDDGFIRFKAVAVIGDKIIKGKYLPAVELQKSFGSMDNTIHDLNHWGTNYMGTDEQNLDYVVGCQKNARMKGNNLETDVYIRTHAPKYDSWHNYIEICRCMNRQPNVSVTFLRKIRPVHVYELPVTPEQYGLRPDDVIPYMYDIRFRALSTLVDDACNDKQGCDIIFQNQKMNNTPIGQIVLNPQTIVQTINEPPIEGDKKASADQDALLKKMLIEQNNLMMMRILEEKR